MALTRWDPFRDLLALHEHLGHLVGSDAPGWMPPVDLYETADDFMLTAELPGLRREDIEIHADDHRIVIRGHRSGAGPVDAGCEQYHRVERGHGSFSRTFTLPTAIHVERISADLKDGVLTVTIPKTQDRTTHRINVTT